MQELERPSDGAGETRAEKTACKILNRVSTSNSTEKNIFVTAETIKTYGRELLYYIASEIGLDSEAAAKVKAVEIR